MVSRCLAFSCGDSGRGTVQNLHAVVWRKRGRPQNELDLPGKMVKMMFVTRSHDQRGFTWIVPWNFPQSSTCYLLSVFDCIPIVFTCFAMFSVLVLFERPEACAGRSARGDWYHWGPWDLSHQQGLPLEMFSPHYHEASGKCIFRLGYPCLIYMSLWEVDGTSWLRNIPEYILARWWIDLGEGHPIISILKSINSSLGCSKETTPRTTKNAQNIFCPYFPCNHH